VVDMIFDKDCVIESDQLGVDRLRVHVRQPSRINPCNPGISGTGDRDRGEVVRVIFTCHVPWLLSGSLARWRSVTTLVYPSKPISSSNRSRTVRQCHSD
jgi:hypothetical protein